MSIGQITYVLESRIFRAVRRIAFMLNLILLMYLFYDTEKKRV